jgi:hypothetical protein
MHNRDLFTESSDLKVFMLDGVWLEQVYTGVWLRHYPSISERKAEDQSEEMGKINISNATKRRLSGIV